ncbi:pyrroline-5-carboxylate reductase family protein [Rhizobium lusitanum]|uniref:pyrroline-5-carboxylate reductase family protein n=1 Tax=Rhizobium lusitanum TaxID=293958 RepID=UPI001574B808|nr:pyrroline-5-carboxylate reductase [Rhizobium lusitanum]NTJ12018.1 pyrroline-5-carboxylate reductase [Rhizobium lusitanum]
MMENGRATLSVLIVGCGNMGAAIANGVVSHMPTINITAVDPNIEKARQLLHVGSPVAVFPDFQGLKDRHFDVCIVSAKPRHVEAALAEARIFLPAALVISIAAGIPLQRLRNAAPDLDRVVRVMPNLPALAGCAMSVGFAEGDSVSSRDQQIVEEIFGAIGQFCWLNSEDEVDLATGVTGSGPGYVFAFTEYLQRAAEQMGFAGNVAEQFARQTVIGAARLLEEDPRSAHDLKLAVTSPGGTTAAGLAILEAPRALPDLLAETTAAAAAMAARLANIQQ